MAHPTRRHAIGAEANARPTRGRGRRAIAVRTAAAAILLCAGLTLLPPLIALNITIGLACPGLDRIQCLALFLEPPNR
jgi:hypothetical protein